MPRHDLWSRAVLAILGALLVLFIIGPLLRLLFMATPASLSRALSDPELRSSLFFTVLTLRPPP